MNEHEIRQYARAGALAMARKIVTEFPDLLAELNRLAMAPAEHGTAGPELTAGELAERRRLEAQAGRNGTPAKRTNRMSEAGRAAIAAAQRRRWAKKTGAAGQKARA